jgi:predicted Zn-dependent peptidase
MIINKTLTNGITVILEQLPYVQSACIGVWVRAGSCDETQNFGISHYIEHMMFKGTDKRTAHQIAAEIDQLGSNINAFTGKEATCYYIRCQSEHIAASIDVLADMFTSSLFDADEMEKERNVILEEMKMIEDNPEDLGYEAIYEAVFADGSYGHSVIGTPESVTAVKREDILGYLDERYTGDNIVISIAGNFDENVALEALELGFASLKRNGIRRDIVNSDFVRASVLKEKDIEQAHLLFGIKGAKLLDDDYYPLQLYANILGGSMSSRLFQSVREQKGLAYSVYSTTSAYIEDGMFLIYAGVNADKQDLAIAAISEELVKFADAGVSDEEVAKAKEQYKGHFIFGRENTSNRMSSMGRNQLLLGRELTDKEILDGVNAVNKSDIMRVAASYRNLDTYTDVIVKSGEK